MAVEFKYFTELDKKSQLYAEASSYLLQHIRNPDTSSEFERRTKTIRKLPDAQLIDALIKNNYNALFCVRDRKVIGFRAFQINPKENSINFFRIFLNKEEREHDLARTMIKKTIEDAIRKGSTSIRQGRINSKTIDWQLKKMGKIFPEHQISHVEKGTIRIRHR